MDKPENPWCQHVATFGISSAQVTASPDNGELIVEHDLDLLVAEGRQEALRDDREGSPAPSMLEYFCRITQRGAAEPESWCGSDAHIIVAGVHENGARITIGGRGLIGRDNMGSLARLIHEPSRQAFAHPV